MKILLIILSIIGSLKLLSLFVLALLQIYYRIKGDRITNTYKDFGFYILDKFYIIPSIEISKTGRYLEVNCSWLAFTYYEATKLEYDSDGDEFSCV